MTSCSRHHYWTRLRAWVTGRQWCHACNVAAWTSVSYSEVAGTVDWEGFPVIPHGGDIVILPDPDFRASDE